MPSLEHVVVVRTLPCLQVLLAFLTVIHLQGSASETLLYGARLGTFPKPDFRTNFTLSSNNGAASFREIRHGLNSDPFYVRVYAKPKHGNNSGFCFNGIGSSQSSPSHSSYGGLLYAYNAEFVRIWAPTNQKGHVVFVKDGWGGEVNTQESNEAEVVVEVWKEGPAPTFQIENVIGTQTNTTTVFLKVSHNLRQRPERVAVRLSPVEAFDNQTNPNGGFWFHAVGASQNPDPTGNFGGVIFAYNEKYVRLWSPDRTISNSGCIFIGKEWGGGIFSQAVRRCRVEILIWVNQLPTPTFQSEWFEFKGQRDQNSFTEIQHDLNELPAFVSVQLRAVNGRNPGYVFQARGATQSDDNGTNEYGGIVFAYDENRVRLWAPSKHDGSKKGYPLLVKPSWGENLNLQDGRDSVMVKVIVYSSKCNGSKQVLYEGNKCVVTLYDSYRMKVSTWSECSSICNNGSRTKSLKGCEVRLKKTVLSCDFEHGMCGWTSSQQGGSPLTWVRTNTATPEADTGPLWGHPKGSYYVYTDTTGATPEQRVTLTSPNTGGADKCHLRFYWNMYGSDVGTLEVSVNTKDPRRYLAPKWQPTGWSTTGPQGDIFWRSAYVDLEKFSRVYQILFNHTLPEGNCNNDRNTHCTVCKNQMCPAANVAIDDIRLDCQIAHEVHKPEVCKKRVAKLAGCEINANQPLVTGPAYSDEQVGTDSYIRAVGGYHDLIAVYQFEVVFTADYVVWKQTFAKSNQTNDISFKIDDGDWYTWRSPHKASHALWTQFYFQQFNLKPGIHRVSLRQEEMGFRLSRLAVVPTKIKMWTDLGMQSRQIPDGLLSAFPLASNPKPRFGRLNGEDAWCSSDHNRGYVYYQVKLPELALLSRVSVQGGQHILQRSNNYWVESFRMKVSLDGENYTWYRDTGGRQTFQANRDAASIIQHTLMFAAPVRGIRIFPWAWNNWICMRIELYGFYLSSELCASAGPLVKTREPCVGDRNCGQNAECRQFQGSSIQKQVMENKADNLVKNTTGSMQTCHCYHGYHGSSCEHYGCTPSPCLNSGSCAQKNNTFHCTCQPGYHGNTCQHSCPPGNYGYNCSQQCQCTEHGSCDAATGHCNCKQGYQGTYCDQVCGPGYFGYNCAQRCQCKNGASCDRITGSCNCTVGWSGAVCDQPCPWNTWGRGCQLNCSCSKSAKFCHRFIGECVCLPGFIGRTCQHPCPAGLYGHNCSNKCHCQRNSTCSGADGTCACTQEGWTGLLCDQPCPGGYYGANCTQKCKCQNGAACHHVTGSCTCTSGWSGQLCDKPCAQGWWGRNCSIPCSCVNGAQCNPVSGQCSCSPADGCLCSPGWTGDACAVACAVGSWGANCRKVCSCQSHGVCHQANGSCRCLSGYTGSKCGLVCPQGTYGPNCIHKCSCASATSLGCDPVHGSCKCRPGYMGPRCDMLCSGGTWGQNCSQSCQCTHGSCDQMSGNCTCDRGWQGLLCDQPCAACGTPCPTCHHRSGPCDKASGKCLCSPGFQGDSCLETCLSGCYGDKCQLRCDCANGGICHHVTGRCACKPGWTGPRCARACPGGSYGQNCTLSCSCAQGTCNATDGSCSCNPGYHGYMCDRPCPSGQFGASCSQKCQCRNAAVCDHVTGRCACSAGWTGKLCNVSCNAASSSHGLFGASCLERCVCPRGVPCDPETGTCTCPRGFQGPNCVQACPRGLFGLNCSQECQCMNNGSCDHVSGTCACTPGWTGANCTDRCPAGSYGMLCDAKCLCNASFTDVTTACDPVTGTCNCRPGYQGHRCDERCPEGYFGKNCRQQCSCQNGGICSFIDGVCNCLPGYHGTTCQLSCPSDRYGYNCNSTCLCVMAHALSCDRVDGTCTCSKGHVGVYCENLCPEGMYGLNCASKCTCKNGAACDHVSGSCTCPAGFKGRDCETPCDRATFGPSCAQQCLCRNGAMCNRFNGDCLCAAGFHGDQCTLECPGGRFGVDCKNNCDCNEANTGQCDKKTGACICHAGFRGGRCDEPCEDGFYGEECKTPCPGCSSHVTGPCNKKTGNCTCSAGYEEYYCLDDCPLDRYGLHCRNPCTCSANQLCHHINGLCLDASRGKFSLIVNDTIEELSADVVRARNIKRGLENLMYLYFDLPATTPATSESTTDANLTQARLSMQDENNSSSEANPTTPNPPSEIPRANDAAGPDPVKPRHVFMVRLLEFQVVVKQDEDKATRVVCVLLDNFTVIDGHYVDEVLSRVPDEDVSRDLMVEYYTGKLHKKTKDSWIAMHLTLIIGVSVGFFLIIVLLTLGAIMRRRHKQKQRFAPYKKSKKEQPEFELQPWIGRNTSYLLAFDNPYYDVLAAMGLDDDVEEDYYNPLYDDVSVYSDSGGNTSEDSCHKDLSAMVIRT